jgi:hypothetical protein
MPKIHLSQIEKVQELPNRVGHGKDVSRNRWNGKHSTYHSVDGVYPYRRIRRLLKASVGKSFDDVFSKYCKEVPVYQQQFFLQEFEETNRGYSFYKYFIDDDGIIQRYKPENEYKGPFCFESIDAQWERRHKVTGKKEPEYFWNKTKEYRPNDYESVLVKGWVKYFDSRQDPEYKRLNSEKQKTLSKIHQEKYGTPKISDEQFRTILKAKELKEKAEDLVKIEAHGFDLTTSFRKEKLD